MKLDAYISSAGHSGSTLLDMMLGSHPRCESVGELIHLPMDMALNSNCGCGQSMQNCSVWPQVMRRMHVDPRGDPYALDLGYAIAMVGDKKRTSFLHKIMTRPKNALKYAELRLGINWLGKLIPGFGHGIDNTLAIYDHIRELTGKEIVVDSSKHYLRAVELYRRQPESTRVIVLVRDGRGVFYSWLKRGYGKRYALNAWRNHYRRLLLLLDKYVEPRHRITVHYEDLVENTRATLEKLCTFLDIDFSETMIDFRSTVHHNVNGNDMKFLATSDLRLDVAWKTALSQDDLEYFDRHAGKLNRQFGYM
jgi:hypothetical protein